MDPTSSTTQGGKSVCHFNVAVNRRKKQDGTQEADFFRVSAFGQMGEACQKYLAKGKKVAVTGQVSAHAYTNNNGEAACSLEVFAQNVEFLSPSGQQGATQAAQPQTPPADQAAGFTAVEEEELPF